MLRAKQDGDPRADPGEEFAHVSREFAPAINRLCRAYEADADERADLALILLAGWRSQDFDGRCSRAH